MKAAHKVQASAEVAPPLWPLPDTMVLRARPLRAGTDPERLPLFGDSIWRLDAAHPDVHHPTAMTLCWDPFPQPLQMTFKAFALAALDYPYPVDPAIVRRGERPAVSTIGAWMGNLRVFACWLHDHGISRLCDVTAADLDAYHHHVGTLACSADRQRDLVVTVRILASYQEHLPRLARLPHDLWDTITPLPRPARWGRTNRTPRIAEATMENLLAWSLRMVEQISTDIIAANGEYQCLEAKTHPCQVPILHLARAERTRAFVDQARREHLELPGHPGPDGPRINWSHLARMLGLHASAFEACDIRRIITESGLDIAADSFVGSITARIDERPWRERPITTAELAAMRRMLSAACYVVICYLSGMRPGEVLNLRRGCAGRDEATGELLVYGRQGKGHDRLPVPEGEQGALRPWVVVAPVHRAITVLERLTKGELLFPASLTQPGSRRSLAEQARTAHQLNGDIEELIAWVNSSFPSSDGLPAIPGDPAKHIHAARFRRTLAYFIVRRPRGLIAAALQYGHVHTKVTLGYSGMADTSWLDDLAVERLEMVLEQTADDAGLLDRGEHISGPSAGEYKTRVRQAALFAGRTVTHKRNAKRLLAGADPSIYHGDGMTCAWRAETALCRKARIDQGLPQGDMPEHSECHSNCANLAYTDRDIAQLRDRHRALTAATSDSLAPQPLRDRASAIAERLGAVIDRHEWTGPSGSGRVVEKDSGRR